MKRPARIAPVRPNAGIEAAYHKRLAALIDEMHRSILYHVRVAWRANPPEMAADRSPARELIAVMRRLGRRWQKRFDQIAPDLAKQFADQSSRHGSTAFAAALRKAGFTVRFAMSRQVNDIVQASVGENVQLIRSIPQQYLNSVQGSVMRAVQAGGDLGTLAKDLEANYGVTRRRAALIARDQSAKATATITRARQVEVGVTQAIWRHSGGGKHPRPEHVAFSAGRLGGPVYDIAKGAFLEGKWTHPGYEINCRCVSNALLPGVLGQRALARALAA